MQCIKFTYVSKTNTLAMAMKMETCQSGGALGFSPHGSCANGKGYAALLLTNFYFS